MMARSLSFLLGIFMLLNSFSCSIDHSFKSRLAKQLKDQNFNGSLLCSLEDSILLKINVGYEDSAKTYKINDSTRFAVASVTKLFVKHSIFILEEQKKLSLDDSLSKYFPQIINSHKITIKDLLFHHSGIPDIHNLDEKYINPFELNDSVDRQILINEINKYSLKDKSSSNFNRADNISIYSNSNYLLLAMIIEDISGKSLEEFVKQNIFDPIGMHNSGFFKSYKVERGYARGYWTNRGITHYLPKFNFEYFKGSGNAFSTVEDMNRYFSFLINQDKYLQPIITQYFIDNKSEIWLLFLIAHSKR